MAGSIYSVPPHLLQSLAEVYEYESSIVSSQSMIAQRFDVSWTVSDLENILSEPVMGEELMEYLVRNHRITPLSNNRFRTDTCELVRLSTFNYNRFGEMKQTTQVGVMWRVEQKKSPTWEFTVQEVLEKLELEFENGWGDEHGSHVYGDVGGLLKATSIVMEAFNLLRGGEGRLSGFQFRSLRDMLRGAKSNGKKTQAIVAGTGLGKSYGFQLGVMISLVHARCLTDDYISRTVHSIFLYPRVALVLDQRQGIIRIIDGINAILERDGLRRIRHVTDAKSMLKQDEYSRWYPNVSMQDFETMSIKKAIEHIYGHPDHSPDVVIGNPDSVRNRMWHPVSANSLQADLRHIVYDEIHLLESISGANGSAFLKRLSGISNPNSEIMLTGSTATVAEEKEHVGNVFGRKPQDVVVSTPTDDDQWELSGLIHHVFHRSKEGQNFQGNVANLSSLVLHERRRMKYKSSGVCDASEIQKSIGFADSLQFLGAWNYLLRDLEGIDFTNPQRKRIYDGHSDVSSLKPKKNPHPYRFNRPLVNLARNTSFSECSLAEVETHCNSCISGQESSLPIPQDDRFSVIHLDWAPNPTTKETSWSPELPQVPSVGITDGCPFFQMGLCWRESESAEPIPLWPNGPTLMPNPMTPLLLTGNTLRNLADANGAQSPDEYFIRKTSEVHDIKSYNVANAIDEAAPRQHVRVALSSPAMEVGVDLDNLTEAILFKAIRNIASYRQKIGRLGRERYRDTYAATLTSFRAIDFHYYRNPTPLLNNKSLEPIPLANNNMDLKKQMAFHAIMDWFTRQSTSSRNLDSNQNHDAVEDAHTLLLSKRNQLNTHLTQLIGVEPADANEAIDAMTVLMEIFLEEHTALFRERTSFSRHLGRPPRRIILTSAGEALASISNSVLESLEEMCNHTSRLMTLESDLASSMMELNKAWKNISEGKRAPQLWPIIEEFNQSGRDFMMKAWNEFGHVDPAVGAIMKFIGFAASFEKHNTDYPNLFPYFEQGRYSVALSILDWNQSCFDNNPLNKWWYFRNVCAEMYMTKHNRPWIFPPTLFEPPAEQKVSVYFPGNSADDNPPSELINLREVLFAYLPGMWSYRRDGRPLKSKCYKGVVELEDFGVLALPLTRDDDSMKHRFVLDSSIPSTARPWGTPLLNANQTEIQMFRPVKLNIMRSKGPQKGNRVFLHDTPGIVADEDDTPVGRSDLDTEDEDAVMANMPECSSIQWRDIQEIRPGEVKAYGSTQFRTQFKNDELLSKIFSSIVYDVSCIAKEFVFGHVRRMTGRPPANMYYLNDTRNRSSAVLGQSFKSNGIKFSVNSEHLQGVLSSGMERLNGPLGGSDRLHSMTHLLMESSALSRFQAEHVLRIALLKSSPQTLANWFDALRMIGVTELNDHDVAWEERTGRPSGLMTIKSTLGNQLPNLTRTEFDEQVQTWIVRTYANSLGIALLQAGRLLSGCRDQDMGYHIDIPLRLDFESLQQINIWLYDRANDGNGTSETINKWFRVPSVVREIARDNPGIVPTLPTRDFVDHLMMFLRPCHAHQSERTAHLATVNGISVDRSELPKRYREDFDFCIQQYPERWNSLAQQEFYSLKEADLLAEMITTDDIEAEEIKKAARVCSTACPQCLEEFGISAIGPLIGPIYANKRLLEIGFNQAIFALPEIYRQVPTTVEGVVDGFTDMGLMELDAEPIEITDMNGRSHRYRPMAQPTHLWEEIDFDSLDGGQNRLQSLIMIRMNQQEW